MLNVEANVTHIIDILILPEFQGQKLGSTIIKDLIYQGRNSQLLLKLGVYKVNTRAKSLYERLGFETFGETDTHYLMQLKPI